MRYLLAIALLLVGLPGMGRADDVLIDNGSAPPDPMNLVVDGRYAFDDVTVRNAPAGDPTEVWIADNALVDDVAVSDTSSLLILNGTVQTVSGYDASSITISDGTVGSVAGFGNSSIRMSDGTVDDLGIGLMEASKLTWTGGTVESSLRVWGSSTALVAGGVLLAELEAAGTSAITLTGGSIGIDIRAADSSVIRIAGSGFQVDGVPVPYGDLAATTGTLTGTLASGDPIDNVFYQGGFSSTMTGTITLVPVDDADGVDIHDPILEAAIRDAVGIPSGLLHATDLEGVTSLWGLGVPYGMTHSVADLTGLEYCTNLRAFGVEDTQVSDLSPLAGLTNLESLLLTISRVDDISTLSGLINLGYLHLYGNQISDVSALSGLTNLVDLDLRDNQISDISPLVLNPPRGSIGLTGNPLDCSSVLVHVPTLIASGAAVNWDDNPSCHDDADGDGVPDAIDNCVHHPNPPGSYPAYRTTTGGQLDDDADGYGNACDAKFSGLPGPVGDADTTEYERSVNKPVSASNCGSSSTMPCDQFDLDGTDPVISARDTIRYKELLSLPAGPRCAACPLECVGDACP